MSEEKQAYRGIMKATSIFGGVQVFQIIIQIIKSKFVAVLLGPSGMGIVGLLTSTIGLITSMTNFGLGTSAVKNVAEANNKGNINEVSKIVAIINKLVWITGFLGATVTLVTSPWLSQLTFNNNDYTFAFAWLSVTLLLNQLATGQRVVLQGLRKIKDLAFANLIGSFVGLLITVPLYYYYGIDGIVPVIIVGSITSFILTWAYSNKIKLPIIKLTRSDIVFSSKEMLNMGFMISLSGLLTTIVAYIIKVYISSIGSVEDVGLYTAGFAIITTYVGLIFTAMGTDYYPRLSAVANDNLEMKKTVNQQAEISILILGPILIGFIVFIKYIVIILYSSKFVGITSMVHWAALGMFFRAIGWSLGFIFLAKGNSKLFFINESIANIYFLSLNIAGYYLYGITGLGLSFLIGYIIYSLHIYLVSFKVYNFSFELGLLKILSVQLLLAIIVFCLSLFFSEVFVYGLGSVVIVISFWYSFIELDKRIEIKSLISKFRNK